MFEAVFVQKGVYPHHWSSATTVNLLSPQKRIPLTAAAQLQCWVLFLEGHIQNNIQKAA